jgi:hypothetical protein
MSRVLAEAWALNPEGVEFSENLTPEEFAIWLATSNDALSPCLFACAILGDKKLVDYIGTKLLRRGLSSQTLIKWMPQLAQHSLLDSLVREALFELVPCVLPRSEQCIPLLELAFAKNQYETVLLLSDQIARESISEAEHWRCKGLRIAALAGAARGDQCLREYRREWYLTGRPFPAPEPVLFVFQCEGVEDLEIDLLAHLDASDAHAEWIKLGVHRVKGSMPIAKQITRWENLHNEHPRDERYLVGLTRAVIAAPVPLRGDRPNLLANVKWSRYLRFAPLEANARAYQMLLLSDDEAKAKYFEEYIAERYPFTNFLILRCALEYVRCLRRGKRWSQAQKFFAKPEACLLNRISPFAEHEFVRLMANVEALPPTEDTAWLWCEDWERILSLPLDSEQIADMLGHFVNLKLKLGRAVLESEVFRDLSLQVLRRGKAEAERLLFQKHVQVTDTREKVRQELRRSGHKGTQDIMNKLIIEQKEAG